MVRGVRSALVVAVPDAALSVGGDQSSRVDGAGSRVLVAVRTGAEKCGPCGNDRRLHRLHVGPGDLGTFDSRGVVTVPWWLYLVVVGSCERGEMASQCVDQCGAPPFEELGLPRADRVAVTAAY